MSFSENLRNLLDIKEIQIGVSVEYLTLGEIENSSDEMKNLIKDLYKLKPTDFSSIKSIIHSLAN